MSEFSSPKAPKDPVKKSQAFYIMRDKEVAGSPMPDGRGIQFIYENDGRLISSAKLVGNIEDTEELDLLKTTEGFKKLVHQIGVCVDTEDYTSTVDFCFQMYGHKDTYGSGTTLRLKVRGDGSEALLNLDDVEWSDDDKEPGQIRFEFDKAGTLATVSVKFYLREGFTAPVPEEEAPVDFGSEAYAGMIARSVINKGNNARLKKALAKAREGKEVTIAFIGGSITQGAGAIPININCYARKTFEGFCDITGRGYDDNVKYVKAGVGGTPSELGMIRYDRDVLSNGKITPDVVIVEFAVNDAGDETNGRCYDSLVRKIYNSPNAPAVLLIFAVFQDDYNLQERLIPVGEAYDLPMVSTKNSVTEQFYKKPDEGRVVSKNRFFYDQYHPTNTGHRIMADNLLEVIKLADTNPCDDPIDSLEAIKAPIGGEFEKVYRIDRKENAANAVIDCGDFKDIDEEIQRVERNMDLTGSAVFPDNWMHKGGDKPFEMDIECSKLLIVYQDSASPQVGTAEVYADGELKLTIDPHIIGWTHCNPLIVIENEKREKHHIVVKMRDEDMDKEFTILGFGVVD